MADIEKFDDPIWGYVLNSKLSQYIPHVRKFWEDIEDIEIVSTGVFPIQGEEVPPGLMYRVTNTPVRSPIKNIQVFPFVPVAYLQITNVAGGANRMVSRVCADNRFKIEEFTIIEKSNLPSTYHQGQFIAFVPTQLLDSIKPLGKWVYLTANEMVSLMQEKVIPSIKYKVIKYI
jgi:hypothetical protein